MYVCVRVCEYCIKVASYTEFDLKRLITNSSQVKLTVSSNTPQSWKESLLFLWDKILGGQFLVDTGAKVSIFPATRIVTRTKQPGALLVTANGSTIRTFWKRTILWCFALKQYRSHFVVFCVEAVQVGLHHRWGVQPFIGCWFLLGRSLQVDLRGKHLMDAETYFSAPLCDTGALAPHLCTISQLKND